MKYSAVDVHAVPYVSTAYSRRQIASTMTYTNPLLSLTSGSSPSDSHWWEASEEEVAGLATALQLIKKDRV